MFEPRNRREARLLSQLDLTRLPRHVAIIMDGNGRWAQRRHLPRIAGHRAGVAAAREAIETCARLGLEVLTLYAFSTENWRRPQTEVQFLMRLLQESVRKELPSLRDNNIRLQIIGRIHQLPVAIRHKLAQAVEETAANTGMRLVVALNYSGRAELVDAFAALLRQSSGPGREELRIDEHTIAQHLYTAGLPDPDLLIRTSGEMRLSNFLLWQIAYTELYVTETLWPDFDRCSLLEALLDYQRRERRYGGLSGAALHLSRGGGLRNPVGRETQGGA